MEHEDLVLDVQYNLISNLLFSCFCFIPATKKYHNKIGDRIFDVLVEDEILVLKDFDILRTAPGKNVPLVVSIPTAVDISDGTMTIDFVENVGDPQINAIEVIFVKKIAPTTTKPNVTAPIKSFAPMSTVIPSKPPKTMPAPVLVPQNVPTKRPSKPFTNAPTNIPVTSRPMVAPVPNVTTTITRRPTNMPTRTPIQGPIFRNVTLPKPNVTVENTTISTNMPTRAPMMVAVRPTLVPTKFPAKVPIRIPVVIATPSNSTRSPNVRTNVPNQTPVVAIPPSTKRPTNTSNVTQIVPVPLNNTNTVPVQRPPVPPPVVIVGNIVHRINCGSTQQLIVPPNNVVWTADQYVTNGQSYNTCGSDHSKNTSMPTTKNTTAIINSIYCTSRYFRKIDATPYRYNLPIPVSNRTYQIRLHFAEQVRCSLCVFPIGKNHFLFLTFLRPHSIT